MVFGVTKQMVRQNKVILGSGFVKYVEGKLHVRYCDYDEIF